ncbi:MAG: hypothetical protein ABL921_34215, partial [Pirellula sp.]
AKAKVQDLTGTAVIVTEAEFIRTESDEFDRLGTLIHHEGISAQGSTPLYNAMQSATEMLRKRGNKGKKLIVISDGANDFGDDDEKLIRNLGGYISPFSDLKKSLEGSGIALYVFQFDNKAFYKQLGSSNDKLQTLDQANRDLFTLVNAMSGMGSMQRPFGDFASLQKSVTDSFSLPTIRLSYDGDPISIPLEFSKVKHGLKRGWCDISIGDSGSNDLASKSKEAVKTRLHITGNEKFELEYSEQFRQLRVIPFPFSPPDGIALSANNSDPVSNRDKWFVSHKINSGVLFEVVRQGQIPFQTATANEKLSFIPRSQFVLATVEASPKNLLRPRYVISDSSFTPSYPPQIVFPALQINPRLEKKVLFNFWFSDEFPLSYLESVSLGDGESVDARTGNARLKCDKTQITIKLASAPDNRVFVLCPTAQSSSREFFAATDSAEGEEFHTFDLQNDSNRREVFLIDESKLKQAVADGKVHHRSAEYKLTK